MTMKRSTGINGFGRFALHLLKYWLDRKREAHFGLDYINDDTLTIEQANEIIQTDTAVVFDPYNGAAHRRHAAFRSNLTVRYTTSCYTHRRQDQIPWVGKPDIFLECSGKNTGKRDCLSFLSGQTKVVAISATRQGTATRPSSTASTMPRTTRHATRSSRTARAPWMRSCRSPVPARPLRRRGRGRQCDPHHPGVSAARPRHLAQVAAAWRSRRRCSGFSRRATPS